MNTIEFLLNHNNDCMQKGLDQQVVMIIIVKNQNLCVSNFTMSNIPVGNVKNSNFVTTIQNKMKLLQVMSPK